MKKNNINQFIVRTNELRKEVQEKGIFIEKRTGYGTTYSHNAYSYDNELECLCSALGKDFEKEVKSIKNK